MTKKTTILGFLRVLATTVALFLVMVSCTFTETQVVSFANWIHGAAAVETTTHLTKQTPDSEKESESKSETEKETEKEGETDKKSEKRGDSEEESELTTHYLSDCVRLAAVRTSCAQSYALRARFVNSVDSDVPTPPPDGI